MSAHLGVVILHMYPDATPLVDYEIRDDGEGAYIHTWKLGAPQPTEVELNDEWLKIVKSSKIALLSDSCQSEIMGQFYVEANQHWYGFDREDQMNLDQQQGWLQRKIIKGEVDEATYTFSWKTKDAGPLPHTCAQFYHICDAGAIHKYQTIEKFWTLRNKVENAQSENEVKEINWQ